MKYISGEMKKMIPEKIVLILVMAQGVTFAAISFTPSKTPVDRLHLRFNQTLAQISREMRLGKLTKDQAKSLKAQVETIRKQEITDLKQDNSKTLTDAQLSQLNQQLNTLSKSIPIK